VAFTALLDACALYSASLRDLLLSLAGTDLFRARWTEAINDEWTRNLKANRPELSAEKIDRTRLQVNKSVPDCLISGYESLIPSLNLPDLNDRHVLAAAIRGRADVIVTYNLEHFPDSVLAGFGMEAWHPDKFVTYLLRLDGMKVCGAIKELRARLRNPPVTPDDYLENLERVGLPVSASLLRPFARLI